MLKIHFKLYETNMFKIKNKIIIIINLIFNLKKEKDFI
jgi:hypothetical protein